MTILEIYARIKQLENIIHSYSKNDNALEKSNPTPKADLTENSNQVETAKSVEAAAKVDMSKMRSEDFKPLISWPEVLEEFTKRNPAVSAALDGSAAYVNQNVLLINAKNSFFLTLFKRAENAKALGDVIAEVTGTTYVIRAKCSTPLKEEDNRVQKLIEKAKASEIPTEIQK